MYKHVLAACYCCESKVTAAPDVLRAPEAALRAFPAAVRGPERRSGALGKRSGAENVRQLISMQAGRVDLVLRSTSGTVTHLENC